MKMWQTIRRFRSCVAVLLASIPLALMLPSCAGTAASSARIEFADQLSPVAELTLNGRAKRKFVVDTGASNSMIKPADAALLGLPETGTDEGVGSTGSNPVRLHRLDRLALSGFERNKVTIVAVDGPSFDDPAIVGLLGVDFFEGAAVRFDFGRNRLAILRRPPSDEPGWQLIASNWLRPWKIMLPIEINGVKAMAFLDTGAQHSVANPALAKAAGLEPRAATDGLVGISGDEIQLQRATVQKMSAGTWHWQDRQLSVAALPVFERLLGANVPQLMLGSDLLKGRAFVIDYAGERVWLER